MLVIPVLERLRQEDCHKFKAKASLRYIVSSKPVKLYICIIN